MHTKPRKRIERKQRPEIDKRPLLTPNILVVVEEVYYGKQGVEREEGQNVGVCPARERIVQGNAADERRRHKRPVRRPARGGISC